MPRLAPAASLSFLLALAAAPVAARAPEIPPPPVIIRHGPPAGGSTLLMTPEADVRCGGAPMVPLYADDLPVAGAAEGAGAWNDWVLDFSVSDEGRTLDIRPAPQGRAGGETAEAIQAVLAAWRFTPGARSDCRLTVRWTARTLDEARPDDLLRYYAVTRTRGPLRDAVAARLAGPGADCVGEAPNGGFFGGRAPRTVSHPDFRIGRRPPPGGRSWTVVRWNVDAEGRTTHIETLGSSGDADLDAETRRAVAETTVRPGRPLTGCVYNFHRIGPALAAPPSPTPETRPDPLSDCPAAVGERFAVRSTPRYPGAFQQRAIEGWALVRFDIASWGQVGAVEVIEVQPAQAFADSARRAVLGGSATAGFEAAVRCVVPVRFRMPDDRED